MAPAPYNMPTEQKKEFYQVGLSANTTGISIYIMGLDDKNWLPETFGKKIGRASVTGYCIKFKALKDINPDILEEAINAGVKYTNGKTYLYKQPI